MLDIGDRYTPFTKYNENIIIVRASAKDGKIIRNHYKMYG